MVALVLTLCLISIGWTATVLFLGWRLFREQNGYRKPGSSISAILACNADRKRLWRSLTAWLASKPPRIAHQKHFTYRSRPPGEAVAKRSQPIPVRHVDLWRSN